MARSASAHGEGSVLPYKIFYVDLYLPIRYGESFLSHPTRPVANAMARRHQAQSSSTPEMVKEEEGEVVRNVSIKQLST